MKINPSIKHVEDIFGNINYKNMSVSLWDHLNNITYEKGPYLGDENFNIHMINRFLSMDEDYCDLVSVLQKNFRPYSHVPNELMYKSYADLIPKRKVFLRYIKATNKKTYDENQIDALVAYFEISKKEAADYIEILDKSELKLIMQQTNYGK